MSSFTLPIKNIIIQTKNYFDSKEFITLEFFINQNNVLTFPIHLSNLQSEVKNKFKEILKGKSTAINLSINENINSILKIDNEFIIFNSVIEINNEMHQEYYLKFENNSIFRNEIRNFLDNN
jgi:hypothetical protein